VSDGTYRYIHNLTPDAVYIEKHLMGSRGSGELNNPYWATWVWNSYSQPATYRLVSRYVSRPEYQLYHTAIDPYEMTNLAGQPKQAVRQKRMRDELQRWMRQQNDPGVPLDTEKAIQAARQNKHLFKAD